MQLNHTYITSLKKKKERENPQGNITWLLLFLVVAIWLNYSPPPTSMIGKPSVSSLVRLIKAEGIIDQVYGGNSQKLIIVISFPVNLLSVKILIVV